MLHYELRKALFKLLILLVIAGGIHFCTYYPEWIEYSYSPKFYSVIADFLRDVLGSLAFSLGDLLYAYWIILILIIVFDFIKSLVRRSFDSSEFFYLSVKNLRMLVGLYIFFQLLWGLNYSRLGVANQFSIQTTDYDTESLVKLNEKLLKNLNKYEDDYFSELNYIGDHEVFTEAGIAINSFANANKLPSYANPSIKKSLYGTAMSYLGISGYFNPFTGEAQVNTKVPKALLPAVCCHEIAHQLGYGSESEANLIGFLSATKSNNNLLRYSAYFDMFLYANHELLRRDSIRSKQIFSRLPKYSKENYDALVQYHRKYENAIEPFFKNVYSRYLQLNNQDNGIQSYNQVVAWLISYYEKEQLL